jgi:hypothetical protein
VSAIPNPTPATGRLEGERRKLAAHSLLEAIRELYIRRGRRSLLIRLLATGTATADDVRAAVELPPGLNPKLFGVVPGPLAEAHIIRSVGYLRSRRPAAHARDLRVWELADRSAALAWLANHPDLPDPEPDVPACPEQRDLFD